MTFCPEETVHEHSGSHNCTLPPDHFGSHRCECGRLWSDEGIEPRNNKLLRLR